MSDTFSNRFFSFRYRFKIHIIFCALVPLWLNSSVFFSTYAEEVKTSLSGEAKGAEGLIIRLYSYDNFIGKNDVLLTQDTINDDGFFNIDVFLNPNSVKYTYFAINRLESYNLFLEAGNHYEIVLYPIDYNPEKIIFPLSPSEKISFGFKEFDETELNHLIWRFNAEYNFFINSNLPNLTRNINKNIFSDFKNRIDSLFADIKNEYFNNFRTYSLAELEMSLRLKSNETLAKKYFHDVPFLYENIAFMNFFNSFYVNFIFFGSQKINFKDIELNIEKNKNYFALLDSLGKDELLQNEVVREMVLIKNLMELYYSNLKIDVKQSSIISMLEEIANKSKFEKHRSIANDIINAITKNIPGKKAEDFILKDINGNDIRFSDYRGKYLYVMFFTTWCTPCLSEFTVMENLYKEYSDSISFLSVSMDTEARKFYYFTNNYSFSWDFVHFGNNFELEKYYNVKVYPLAILIDPNGNIVTNTAKLPTEDLTRVLYNMFRKEKDAELKYEIWRD